MTGTDKKREDSRNRASRAQRLYEVFAWIALVALLWTVDTFTKLSVRASSGVGKANFALINDQATSALSVLIMVVFVVHWMRLFPLERQRWVPMIIGHSVGSMIFAFGHFTLAVVMRVFVYWVNDLTYHWQTGYAANLIAEYQKDIKIYLGILAVLSAYDYYQRHQTVDIRPANSANQLIVQTGMGEAVVRYEQIEYIAASRNYAVIHTADREFLIRDTIANLEKLLAHGPFARSHRSFIVNLQKISEIRTKDGSQHIHLKSGADVPVSRSYKTSLRTAMTSA